MAFYLPSKYRTLEDVPKPTDPRVTIRELPERVQAVRKFTWSLKEANVQANRDALMAELDSDPDWEIAPAADGSPAWHVQGYNPPFTLPWWKTNEIVVDVRRRS